MTALELTWFAIFAAFCEVMLAGCATAPVKVISSDRTVARLKADQMFKAPVDGWFVPDARWMEIREAIGEAILTEERKEPQRP